MQTTVEESRLRRFLGSSLRTESVIPYATTVLLLILIGLPVATGFLMSLKVGLPGQVSPITLSNYVQVLDDPGTLETIFNTALFTIWTLVTTFAFSTPLVWLMNRTDLPFKGMFYVLLALGIVIPVFLKVMGWIMLVSPQIGILNVAARSVFGLQAPLFNVYSVPWMGFIQGLSFAPMAFFMLSASYQAMDPSLEEAAFTSGMSKLTTLLRINLPISLPAILAVLIYVTMLAVAVFETPALLGLPGRIFLLSSSIYFAVNPPSGLPSYGLAGAYGSILLVLALAFGYLYSRVLRKGSKYVVITGRGYRPKLLELGKWKGAAVCFVMLYFVLEFFLPLLALVWASLLPYFQVPSMTALSQISLNNYAKIDTMSTYEPFLNTAILMLVVPTVTLFLSVVISWVIVRTQFRWRTLLDNLAFLPHATPHILLAVAISYLALVYRSVFPLYNTIWIIVLAHIISYIAYSTRTLNSSMIQVHRELEEAGTVAGMSGVGVLRHIVTPLVAPAVFNAWIWVMLLSYREVTMALILRGPGNTVISSLLWQLWVMGELPIAAAMGTLIILFMIVLAVALRAMFARGTRFDRVGN